MWVSEKNLLKAEYLQEVMRQMTRSIPYVNLTFRMADHHDLCLCKKDLHVGNGLFPHFIKTIFRVTTKPPAINLQK